MLVKNSVIESIKIMSRLNNNYYKKVKKRLLNKEKKQKYDNIRYREARLKWNRKNKRDWIEFLTLLGYNKCSKCGYDKCWGALDFHHRDPTKKEKGVSLLYRRKKLNAKNIMLVLREVDKCDVLCANCHRELHYMGYHYIR
jgi:hypothetical protein